MIIKYCKNCVNFVPKYEKNQKLSNEEYAWGYCRIINKLEVKDNKIRFVESKGSFIKIQKQVAVNQVVIVDDQKLCPAFSSLSDRFDPERYNLNVSSLEVLDELQYINCKNCNKVFASENSKLDYENEYMCPICFHTNTYKKSEHSFRQLEFFKLTQGDGETGF